MPRGGSSTGQAEHLRRKSDQGDKELCDRAPQEFATRVSPAHRHAHGALQPPGSAGGISRRRQSSSASEASQATDKPVGCQWATSHRDRDRFTLRSIPRGSVAKQIAVYRDPTVPGGISPITPSRDGGEIHGDLVEAWVHREIRFCE
jgi:hypothetical protein